MAKLAPDSSFQRDGIELCDWLWHLLAGDKATRASAGDALVAMETGLPSVHTDFSDLTEVADDTHPARYAAAVRAAVTGPDFATGAFVRRLGASTSTDWFESSRRGLSSAWARECAAAAGEVVDQEDDPVGWVIQRIVR